MKPTLRWLGIALGFGLLLLAGFAVFVAARGVPHYAVPVVAAPTLTNTPAQVELGEHLVRASCAECHLNKQTNRLSGHQLLDTPTEFGALYSSNITQSQQHGIGAWTDAEIAVLLRTGVGRDGRYRLIMPHYTYLSDDDLAAILTFLHSDRPWVRADPTPSRAQQPSFLLKALTNTVMKPTPLLASTARPVAASSPVAYGRYLVVGRYLCYECHSKDFKSNNALEPEKSAGYLGGGNLLLDQQGQPIRSANITGTGIGGWSPAQLAATLRFGQGPHGPVRYPMPKYSAMTDAEVQAIYAYLQSVPRLPAVK
ncbi:cytochrome c [Hymenobacter sp. RP-2-7]|uniref:Cytochrome c n=1 Tax=Hymenobacter polaris TaxID=2682546 RepID=A0A7Y0FKP4_9BACT|nr:c-type cytochrome [Hymenobacter polaris]NML63927.1 cytochrome c [Hymenobacter polaris]